jgi:hypothetical protein
MLSQKLGRGSVNIKGQDAAITLIDLALWSIPVRLDHRPAGIAGHAAMLLLLDRMSDCSISSQRRPGQRRLADAGHLLPRISVASASPYRGNV